MFSLFKKNSARKLGGLGMIILSVMFLVPQSANAQYVDISNAIKEYVADPIVYLLVNKVIERLASQTVNWINSGFKGNPGFVTDPGQFFLDVADSEASRFLSTGSLNKLCSPFKAQVRLALVKNYLSDNQTYTCTLGKIKDNYDQFTHNFSQGGWDAWFEVTQNSQNNPYGSYLNAQNQLSINIGTQQNKYEQQLQQGSGFLSFQKCKTPVTQAMIDSANSFTASDEGDGESNLANYKVGDCFNNETTTVTPGKVIESQLNSVLGTGVGKLVAADEVDEIIGALLNQLVSQVVGGTKGLLGSSEQSSGQSSYTTQLNDVPRGKPSNPNPGNVTGGTVDCSTSGPQTTYDTDPVTGEVTYSTSGGGSSCTNTPVVIPPIITNDGSTLDTGGGSGGGGGGGGTSGSGQYADSLMSALTATASENPNLVNVSYTPSSGRAFLSAVVAKLQASGFNATNEVLNGNGNPPSSGDMIAVWKNGDTQMERYDTISSGGNIAGHLTTQYSGRVPLDCTVTGGNKSCKGN